jgi:hypothetical protein
MLTCCEIALTLAFTNLLSLAIFAGYTINLKSRTLKLERKNGHELEQIKELKGEIRLLKALMTLSEETRQKEAQRLSSEESNERADWGDKN